MPLNCIPKYGNIFEFITLDELEKIGLWWGIGEEIAVGCDVLTKTMMRWSN